MVRRDTARLRSFLPPSALCGLLDLRVQCGFGFAVCPFADTEVWRWLSGFPQFQASISGGNRWCLCTSCRTAFPGLISTKTCKKLCFCTMLLQLFHIHNPILWSHIRIIYWLHGHFSAHANGLFSGPLMPMHIYDEIFSVLLLISVLYAFRQFCHMGNWYLETHICLKICSCDTS